MKAISSAILLLLVACTVTPRHVKTEEVSFDGSVRNGGFIGYETNGWGVITPSAKVRYDHLVERFGNSPRFATPVKPGEGLMPYTNGTWLIDPEHNRKAQTMNRWLKESP